MWEKMPDYLLSYRTYLASFPGLRQCLVCDHWQYCKYRGWSEALGDFVTTIRHHSPLCLPDVITRGKISQAFPSILAIVNQSWGRPENEANTADSDSKLGGWPGNGEGMAPRLCQEVYYHDACLISEVNNLIMKQKFYEFLLLCGLSRKVKVWPTKEYQVTKENWGLHKSATKIKSA